MVFQKKGGFKGKQQTPAKLKGKKPANADSFFDQESDDSENEQTVKTPGGKTPKGKQAQGDRRVSFQIPGKNTPNKTPKSDNSLQKKQPTPGKQPALKEFKGLLQNSSSKKNDKSAKKQANEDSDDDDDDDDDDEEDDDDFDLDMLGDDDDDDDDDDDEDDDEEDDEDDSEGDEQGQNSTKLGNLQQKQMNNAQKKQKKGDNKITSKDIEKSPEKSKLVNSVQKNKTLKESAKSAASKSDKKDKKSLGTTKKAEDDDDDEDEDDEDIDIDMLSEDDDDSEDEESEEEKPQQKKQNQMNKTPLKQEKTPAKNKTPVSAIQADDTDDSEDEESEEEKPQQKKQNQNNSSPKKSQIQENKTPLKQEKTPAKNKTPVSAIQADDTDDSEDEESEEEKPQQKKQNQNNSSPKKSQILENKTPLKQEKTPAKNKTPVLAVQAATSPKKSEKKDEKPIGYQKALELTEERKRDRDARTLYVGNLPKDVTVSELKALSTDILNVSIPQINSKNRKHAFAFLEFANEDKAEENYKLLKSKKLRGQPIRIDYTGFKRQNNLEEKKENPNINLRKLYIGSIPVDATIDKIAVFFPKAVQIQLNVSPTFRHATVNFMSDADAAEALENSKSAKLDGKPLTVLYSVSKDKGKKRKRSRGKKGPGAAKKMKPEAKKESSDDDDDDDDEDDEE